MSEQMPDPLRLRASDSDRERYVAVLREAYAEGRLDAEEYEERMSAAYQARTYGDLVPLLHDLPGAPNGLPGTGIAGPVPGPGLPVAGAGSAVVPGGAWGIEVAAPGTPVPDSAPAVAIFGGAERKGRWIVPVDSSAVAIFGGVEMDLSQAVLGAREVTIHCVAIFGGIDITVPHGVQVELNGLAIFGGRAAPNDVVPIPPGAPVVRIDGYAFFGGVDVHRPKKVPPQPPALPAAP